MTLHWADIEKRRVKRLIANENTGNRRDPLLSDHHKGLFAAKQKRKLVNHRLDNVLQIRSQLLKVTHVGELDGDQSGPPANRQILTVHAVQLGILRHPAIKDNAIAITDTEKLPPHQRITHLTKWWKMYFKIVKFIGGILFKSPRSANRRQLLSVFTSMLSVFDPEPRDPESKQSTQRR